MKYGFLGCGNMGGAIARALSRSTKDIAVTDRSGKAEQLARELGLLYTDNAAIAANSKRIFLAVKPFLINKTFLLSAGRCLFHILYLRQTILTISKILVLMSPVSLEQKHLI